MRFRNVTDGRMLEVKLDNIFINRNKIHVNTLRFQRRRGVSIVEGNQIKGSDKE